jgi:predicted transcriptional regulator
MITAKETVQQILEGLPDDPTIEDIQYRIYVRKKLEDSLRDAEEGRLLDHEEVGRKMARWLSEY